MCDVRLRITINHASLAVASLWHEVDYYKNYHAMPNYLENIANKNFQLVNTYCYVIIFIICIFLFRKKEKRS